MAIPDPVSPNLQARLDAEFELFAPRYKAEILKNLHRRHPYESIDPDELTIREAHYDLISLSPAAQHRWRDGVLSTIGGATVVCALLAIVFGILATYAMSKGNSAGTSMLDVAKIFAGAIVGSVGATTISRKS